MNAITDPTRLLPAPARFKVSKAIRLPSVKQLSRELDRVRLLEPRKDNEPGYWGHTKRELAEMIESIEANLDFAEFAHAYVGSHNCTPRILESSKDAWGSRRAKIQIEDSIYWAYVSMGRTRRGMYGKHGHEWNMTVRREGADRRLVDGDRVEKSAGLGSEALRQHLMWKWRITRGIRDPRDKEAPPRYGLGTERDKVVQK